MNLDFQKQNKKKTELWDKLTIFIAMHILHKTVIARFSHNIYIYVSQFILFFPELWDVINSEKIRFIRYPIILC